MNHQVVFGDQVNPAAALRDAHQLGYGAFSVRDGLQHVPADGEIERAVGETQLENTAIFEANA
jgi:hypothetical protein